MTSQTPNGNAEPTNQNGPSTTAYMTQEQAEILATLTTTLRPDWDQKGIISVLEKLALTMSAGTLTLGLLHAATIPTNETPGILLHPGKHWDRARGIGKPAKPAEPQRSSGIDTSPLCPNHPELHEWECKACKQPSPPPANFKQMVQEATEAARQAMNAALDTVNDAANTTQDDLALAAPAD